jgi:hypothetical protein
MFLSLASTLDSTLMLTRTFESPTFFGELKYNDRQFTVRYKVTEKPAGETVEKTFRHTDRETAQRRYQIVVQLMERASRNSRGLMSFGLGPEARKFKAAKVRRKRSIQSPGSASGAQHEDHEGSDGLQGHVHIFRRTFGAEPAVNSRSGAEARGSRPLGPIRGRSRSCPLNLWPRFRLTSRRDHPHRFRSNPLVVDGRKRASGPVLPTGKEHG